MFWLGHLHTLTELKKYFKNAFFSAASAQNECFNTVYKELGNLAKRNPTYFQDAVPLCDRYLLKGWYVALHNEMPTSAPDLGYCGTTYPYWLDGILFNYDYQNNTLNFLIWSFWINRKKLDLFLGLLIFLCVIFLFYLLRYIAKNTGDIKSSKSLWSWFLQWMFTKPLYSSNKLWVVLCLWADTSWHLFVSILFS